MNVNWPMLLLVCLFSPGCLPAERAPPPATKITATVREDDDWITTTAPQDDRPPGLRMIGSPEELRIRQGAYNFALTPDRFLPSSVVRVPAWSMPRQGITITAYTEYVSNETIRKVVMIWSPDVDGEGKSLVYQAISLSLQENQDAWGDPRIFRPGAWMQTVDGWITEAKHAELKERYGAVD